MNERIKCILCRLGDLEAQVLTDKRAPLSDFLELEHRIEALEEGRATPAAVHDLLDRLSSLERWRSTGQAEARISDLEARQRETEDIRALAADKISAEKNWRDTSKAVSRALTNATSKMRRRRQQARDK